MSRSALAAAVLTLLACRDAGEEAYARARTRHEALLMAGTRPEAKAYDEVLADLDRVPPSSPRAPDARRLSQAIRAGREPVRAPLAVAPNPDGGHHPDVLAQLERCAQLARAAGLDGGLNPDALRDLDRCRERAEKLDIAHAHGDEPR